ncbi:MAG: UDP-N-acetylmuramate--L-alanine ligase [Clostridia bacterium]|nr:UDP-N-acetylmuramate--L-alanine ligase [Clostridia bacterium]
MSKFNSFLGFEKIADCISKKDAHVHFVGAGGISMYSLFVFTRARGISASGSDKSKSERTEKLIARGEDVKVPENIEAVAKASLLVYSLAVSENDAELRIAEELGIPAISRAEYLAYLSLEYKMKLSVSGSHGKSTATAMLAKVLSDAELFPSAISGAELSGTDEPYIMGSSDYLVFEACEYKDSFLKFTPDISVFLNLELDHTDYFKSFDDIGRSFLSAMERARVCVVNKDDRELYSLATLSESRIISFGIEEDADIRAVNLKSDFGRYSFSVVKSGEIIAEISLSVLGKFSVYNALAAFSAAYTLGVEPSVASKALSGFCGIGRRLENLGKRKDGSPIIYDYAHHPSEIASSISAVRELFKGEIAVIFKPHTYTRTRDLFDAFVTSLALADKVYLSEIDAIRESAIKGINAESLAKAIGGSAEALSDDLIIERVKKFNGAIIIMGAGNVEKIKAEILSELMLDNSL